MRPSINVQRLVPYVQRVVPESLQQDPTVKTRTENLIAAMFLTSLVALGFGFFYLWRDHLPTAATCFAAAMMVLGLVFVLHVPGSLALARNMLVLTIFVLLLVLTYYLDGVSAPTSFWLAACPLVATVTGGRRAGLNWALIALFGVGLIFASDALGLIPPTTFTNLWLIEVVSEFLLLLVATDAAMGKSMADRLRECVEDLPLPPELQGRRATVSVGVAEHAWPETIEQTISRADSALYEAKRAGRNRVVVARPAATHGSREFG